MDTTTVAHRHVGPQTGPFAVWVADRCAADARHCVGVDTVGRSPDGRLVVQTEELTGTALPEALDRIGGPTTGVAVTLTLPLVDLALDAAAGVLLLGEARADDVLVDDSGAPVLVDHPPGADPTGTAAGRTSDRSGEVALLHAVRAVWERVDDRAPCRATVDAALAAALTGGRVDDLRRLRAVVRATGPPRPVRWDPPADDLVVVAPRRPPPTGLVAVMLDALERGVPFGAGVRVSARRVLVAVVVAGGVVVAGLLALTGA